MAKKTDAVFEGGGVKGIGLVGAISEIEKAGYEFQNLAGTSAGAIVAGLLAVGYSAAEIKQEMEKLDYNKFKDEGPFEKIGFIGKALISGWTTAFTKGSILNHGTRLCWREKGRGPSGR